MDIKRVKGTRDFYPEQMFRRRWLEDLWRKVSLNNGLLEYDGPILEHLELFDQRTYGGVMFCFYIRPPR